MKKIGFLSLLAACIFAACSESDSSVDQQPAPQRLITVEVSENPLTDEATGAPALGITRTANYTTTESLHEFSMNYTGSYKYNFTKSGSTWTSSLSAWPVEDDNVQIDFYAYTGGTFNYNGGNPYVVFTVNSDASTQHDLLVAKKKVAYSDDDGKVGLSFDHACAVVQFNIGQSSTLSGQPVTYTSIALVGVKNSGKYYYNSSAWGDLTGDVTCTMESASNITIPVSTTAHAGARPLSCGYLFMIPQNHSDAKIRIDYTKGGVSKTADIPLTIDWQAGHLYTINVRLGTSIIN